MTKLEFIKILKDSDLIRWFQSEYGEEWEAKESHLDGWWFEDDALRYRACDLFSDHADGYKWSFQQGDRGREMFVVVMKSHGYEVTHDSGDEEDGLFRMKLKNQ